LKLITKISHYVNTSKKPWFLTDGPRYAGKSSFLTESGVSFASVDDDGPIGSRLFITADAVYIDPPSSMASASDDVRAAFYRRLLRRKFLRRRAFDGLLIVIDIQELLRAETDAATQYKIGADLRLRADAVAAATGYDVPVYFIFNKIDTLDCFKDFFGDKGNAGGAAGRLPVLGAVSGGRDSMAASVHAVTTFVSRFREVCADLSEVCVRNVISADNPGHYDKNCRLYRFLTRFTLAETPIASFIKGFFRPRGNDNVRFCGFFFTSSNGNAPSALSGKIVGDIIPKTPYRAKAAAGTLSHYIGKAGSYILTGLLWAALVSLLVGGGLRDAAYIRSTQTELTEIFKNGAEPANQFAALEKLRLSNEYLQGKFRYPWRLIFGTEKVNDAVRRAYAAASERIAAEPAARYLEESIKRRIAEHPNELPALERSALYGDLSAYLLLTSGNHITGIDTDSMARRIGPAFKNINGARDDVVIANIYTTVKSAAEGIYKNVPADNAVIEAAREKLAAAPQAAAIYASVMDKLSSTHNSLPMPRITGGGGLLKYGRDVSDLYTRSGWENAVFPEFIKASKEPIKADWVTGPAAAALSGEKLLSELASLYADDLGRRWLDFIRNTYVNVRPNLPSLARDLELLAARDCETERMLAAVCSLATQQPADLSLSNSSDKSASSIKKQVSGAVNKLRGGAAMITHDISDPFAEARTASFAHVEAFMKNGALDAYRSGLGKLAEKIRVCGDRGSYVPFIARGADDPLRECRLALDRAYASMPAHVSASVKRIFESPLDIAAAALTKAVTDELEESWKAEVVNPYVNKLINRYPIDKKGNDAAWSDFEEFFKPQSGILWKYCDKNLSGIAERTSRGWEGAGRSVSLPLSLNDEILRRLNDAERITDNFFKKDGTPKRHEIIFRPIKSSNGEAALLIGDKTFDFKNGQQVTIGRQQGAETDEPLTVRLTAADKAQEEMRFTGEWAALRLFEAGKIDRLGNDRYRINWKLNVRGIYTANITAAVQCNTAALFDKTVIESFNVPSKVFRND